jgi:spermidine/putrescine transport system permease protein
VVRQADGKSVRHRRAGDSLIVAFTSAVLASVFGTMAALGLQGVRGPAKAFYDGVIYVSIMVPGIVIGIATLIALVSVFNLLNPALAVIWPQALGAAPH